MEIALPTEDVSMRLSDLRDLERNVGVTNSLPTITTISEQIRFDLPRAEPSMSIAVLSAVGSKLLDTWSRVKNAWDEVRDEAPRLLRCSSGWLRWTMMMRA